MKNWKTSLAGFIAAALVAAKPVVNPKYHALIDTGLQIAIATGLVAAGDASKPAPPEEPKKEQ